MKRKGFLRVLDGVPGLPTVVDIPGGLARCRLDLRCGRMLHTPGPALHCSTPLTIPRTAPCCVDLPAVTCTVPRRIYRVRLAALRGLKKESRRSTPVGPSARRW